MPHRKTPSIQRTRKPSSQPNDPEVVDPRWLLKAFVGTILAAIFCGYLTLCTLFYFGQWQLVLHPARTTASQSPVAITKSDLIRFAPDESAVPQLTGWWIPAAPGGRYATTTILYLRSGDGSLADSSAALNTLHSLGINIFAFDYRGYGQSAPTHPTQLNMTQDAEAAWQYLALSRAIPADHIVPYGIGVGTSIAALLAATHPAIPALILEAPRADLLDTALQDPRTQMVPARLLFHETFPLAAPLAHLSTPKLLLSLGAISPAFNAAGEPKLTAELTANPTLISQPAYIQTLIRFLDQYTQPAAIPQLVPPPAPAAQ
jgi:pimeloyl-ACP methyl ester carboxylesterase